MSMLKRANPPPRSKHPKFITDTKSATSRQSSLPPRWHCQCTQPYWLWTDLWEMGDGNDALHWFARSAVMFLKIIINLLDVEAGRCIVADLLATRALTQIFEGNSPPTDQRASMIGSLIRYSPVPRSHKRELERRTMTLTRETIVKGRSSLIRGNEKNCSFLNLFWGFLLYRSTHNRPTDDAQYL